MSDSAWLSCHLCNDSSLWFPLKWYLLVVTRNACYYPEDNGSIFINIVFVQVSPLTFRNLISNPSIMPSKVIMNHFFLEYEFTFMELNRLSWAFIVILLCIYLWENRIIFTINSYNNFLRFRMILRYSTDVKLNKDRNIRYNFYIYMVRQVSAPFFFVFFIYNSHTIKFIVLNCVIQWCIVYSQSHATITI